MKILSQDTPKPRYPWMEHPWQCLNCASIVEFDAGDVGEEGFAKNGGYLTYRDDQRDGESLSAPCPVCTSAERWTPVTATWERTHA